MLIFLKVLDGSKDLIKKILLDTKMKKYRERRDLVVSGFNAIPNISCVRPGGAFYAFVNIKRTGMSSERIVDYLLENAGVAVLPGSSFGKYGDDFIRFCYASSKENIQQGLDRIKNSLTV